MNLTTDAWIPIVWNDGRTAAVSLHEAFERGHDVRDLVLRPHERIAVMRLLICIVQAALDGPKDHADWQKCQSGIARRAVEYLNAWKEAFELLGDGRRFLQVVNLKEPANTSDIEDQEEGGSATKMDVALATGNNSTLFDNAGGACREFTPERLSLMLVTFQCYSPGGRIGVALWDGTATPGNGSSKHAPCLAGGMLHTLLRGDNLLSTLHRNLLNKEQLSGSQSWGRPVWEVMPSSIGDEQAVRNATQTYLGRLAALARSIRISNDGRRLILANGLEYATYAEGWREPASTIVTHTIKEQPTRVVLSASVERAAWRELHALTVKSVGQSPGGPLALQNIDEGEGSFDLWVGGLVANKAKLVDATESVFHVPAAMLGETSQMIYEKGVKYAASWESRLRRAVSAYHRELGDNIDRTEMKNRRHLVQRNATVHFWTDIEKSVPRLLEAATTPESLGLRSEWRKTEWGRAVNRAARDAYERACPHETVRQVRAYVLGLNRLVGAPAAESEVEEEVEW